MKVSQRSSLGDLAGAWDRLVDRAAVASPFMKSWFVDNAVGGQPVILTCHDPTGALVGGVAFELDLVGAIPRGTGLATRLTGVRRVRMAGQGVIEPDHLDVLSEPQHRVEVLAAVARWLRAGNWIVDLDGLSATCELPHLLAAPILSRTAAPYLPLATEDPVADLPGRLRNTIKRSSKRLARAGFATHMAAPSEAERALRTLLGLHDHRWADRSSLGPPPDRDNRSTLVSALTAGLRCGGAVIHELTDGTTVIASEIELLAGRQCAFYQAGRLTDREFRGSGSVLKAEVLRWAAENGMEEFDLLRGDEAYKRDWSTSRREVLRMRTGFGPLGRPAAWAMNRWHSLAPRARELANRVGSPTSELREDLAQDGSRTS